MFPLINEVLRYAWGSRTAMAEFLGSPSPSAEPEAELWIGAYPACPSKLPDGRTLLQLIADDPQAALSPAGVARFGPRLPFLMKVLTIGAPLSLQAHPNAAQAAAGFAAEEAAGLSLDAPARNYRDGRHKPELLCALTPVEAFCGFRPAARTVAMLDMLGVSELEGLRHELSARGLTAAVDWIFGLPEGGVHGMVRALGAAARAVDRGTWPMRCTGSRVWRRTTPVTEVWCWHCCVSFCDSSRGRLSTFRPGACTPTSPASAWR